MQENCDSLLCDVEGARDTKWVFLGEIVRKWWLFALRRIKVQEVQSSYFLEASARKWWAFALRQMEVQEVLSKIFFKYNC